MHFNPTARNLESPRGQSLFSSKIRGKERKTGEPGNVTVSVMREAAMLRAGSCVRARGFAYHARTLTTVHLCFVLDCVLPYEYLGKRETARGQTKGLLAEK